MTRIALLLILAAAQALAVNTYRGWQDVVFDYPDSWTREERDHLLVMSPDGKATTGVYLIGLRRRIADARSPELDKMYAEVLKSIDMKVVKETEMVVVEEPVRLLRRWTLERKDGTRTAGLLGAAVINGDTVALMVVEDPAVLGGRIQDLRLMVTSARAEGPPSGKRMLEEKEYTLSFQEQRNAVYGGIVNNTRKPWVKVYVHIEFRDAEGKTVKREVRPVQGQVEPKKAMGFLAFYVQNVPEGTKPFFRVKVDD